MIERIYVDNVCTFVGFEWRPDRFALLLGDNGCGKSALMCVLEALQRFVEPGEDVHECFPASRRTAWERRTAQTFELDLRRAGALYRYRLVVDVEPRAPERLRVREERLHLDETLLLDHTRDLASPTGMRPTSDLRARRSVVGGVTCPRATGFAAALRGLRAVAPNPGMMANESAEYDQRWLATNLFNFVHWYRGLLRRETDAVVAALHDLDDALPGLAVLRVDPTSQGRLRARFEPVSAAPYEVDFSALSRGERVLIALYVLLRVEVREGHTIFFDAPDAHLALPQVQPWLMALAERAMEPRGAQVFLATHHPEALNLFASSHGWRMSRAGGGATRIERFQGVSGLVPAEAVARGWTA